MIADYNPFNNKRQCEKTPHGMINYRHDMGTVYLTHRKQESFFKKYNGFAISETELEIAYNARVSWVLILYHKDNGDTIAYRTKMNNVEFLEGYNNGKSDKQIIFPLKILQQKDYKTNFWV